MYPGGNNDPNNVARMAQLLKNPQYLSMLANKMNTPFLQGQPTLIHHPTAGTTITPNAMALIQSAALQQQQQQQQANINATTNGGARIMPSTASIIPNGNGGVNNNNNGAVSKWHDDLSRHTRQELFNTIVEIKTGKSFNGDKSSIDSNLSKSILNQISRIWKQTNSKEQFAHELSQWLATENTGVSETDIEKKLLELMNKPGQQQKPSSSVGVENLFGMMTTAASSIGTNSSFPNITNPINSAKNPTGGTNTTTATSTSTTTTTSNTNTSTTTNTAVNNTNGVTTTSAPPVPSTNPTNPPIKKISPQDIEKYLGFADFLKQHEDMIRQYIRSVATQHADLTKRLKTFSVLSSEEQNKVKASMQKNQMILAESKALDKLLSLTTREDRVKLLENLTQKSFAFAVHIKDVIEKKLKPVKTDTAQPPTATAPPPPPTTSATATNNTSSTTVSSVSSTSSINNATAVPVTNQPSVTPTPTQSANQQTAPASSSNPPSAVPSTNHKKESGDDGFFNLKKIGESSIITFNQDSFYSALGEMNIKNLTHSTKRKLIPESTEHEKVLKRVKTPIDILQNNLTNLIEFDNVIEFKNTINIKLIEDARYQLDFIINPIEKGILNLPILTLCVIVNHNEIIPYSISFSQNYANEKNSIFVNIRKYFNNLLIENTTSFINTSDMLSTQNNTYHIQRYNLSLNCILNSWITSINTVVKKELQ
ncbi:predicted protein [Naegleria gruberi]|uniref:Predicted protein n=1 Tax=Naegleria gruberi TaxID=5762 RepID=D2V3H7_NAEGR|nr:uncharacterized protein NAEGRDRAFT_63367 [Naegleria gruberi]EFC48639.1 predicted protein [Naegleria gruberi]|eukprot:XP_002681383.1 predicted protein [Naegleria gruberi strain NEG-M]